jgi:hypothetical protein
MHVFHALNPCDINSKLHSLHDTVIAELQNILFVM